MHPLVDPLTIRATAKGYVGKIDMWIEESRIEADGSYTVISPMAIVNTCNPILWVRSLTCTHVIWGRGQWGRHEDGRMIKFKVTATRPFGSPRAETYQFASGVYPFLSQPVPIRVKGDVLKKIDIVMIRDEEIDLSFFRRYLDNVIEESFFDYSAFWKWRSFYNFYYSAYTGTYSIGPTNVCAFSGQPNVIDALLTNTDAIVFFHTDEKQDCRDAAKFSSELWFDKSLIHEAGHALFGLRDEYPASLGPQCTGPRNIWRSQAECQAEARSYGLEPHNCVIRGSGPEWKIDKPGPAGCIMNGSWTQWQPDSDYGPACMNRVRWHIRKCAEGGCIPEVKCEQTAH